MDLPNEIIREICDRPELEREDLRSLRLTSNHLRESASDHFSEDCFSEITILMTRPSLKAFIELSQHLSFGPAVQEISFSAMLAPYDDTNFRAPLSLETMESLEKRCRMERALMMDGDAEQMLSVAFKAFAQREQPFSLHVCDSEGNVIGARGLLLDKCFGENLVWHTDWRSTIERTIRAVTTHSCKVNQLCIEETFERIQSLHR